MEKRRRIRDLTHGGERWIVSLVAEDNVEGVWRGRVVFHLDEPTRTEQFADSLVFEALDFDELMTQASSVSVDHMCRRLRKLSEEERT